MHHSCKA